MLLVCAMKIGLRLKRVKCQLAVKFVQRSYAPIQVVTYVLVQMGKWKTPLNFIIVTMEEFKVTLGLHLSHLPWLILAVCNISFLYL